MKTIIFIEADIVSVSPMFIGDDEQEILIDNENQMAYLPATSIAGAFRSYLGNENSEVKRLFGDKDNTQMSKIYIKDAFAKLYNYDIRDGLRIDGESGTNVQGAKIERMYISAGLKFSLNFEIHLESSEDEELKLLIYKALKGIDAGILRFGGHKSSGLGVFQLKNATEWGYNLGDFDNLLIYLNREAKSKKKIIDDVLSSKINHEYAEFIMKGKFTTPIIIGAPRSFNPDAADDTSIKTGNDEYIIPGSSLKGLLRYRMETIANYFGKKHTVEEIFGQPKSIKGEKARHVLSRVFVQEAVIDTEDYKDYIMYNRIKLDKFTSGVDHGSLMQDVPIKGRTAFSIIYRIKGDKHYDNYAIGLIALALRDLGTENISIGGNENIGRGRFKADTLHMNIKDDKIFIDFNNQTIENRELLSTCIDSIKRYNSGGEA